MVLACWQCASRTEAPSTGLRKYHRRERTTDERLTNDGRTTDERRTNDGRTTDERRTNDGRTTDERRTNDGRTTDERRTNDGRTTDERRTNDGRTTDERRTNGRHDDERHSHVDFLNLIVDYSIMYVTSCYRVTSHQDELRWMSPGAVASDAILPDTAEEPCLTYVDILSLH